MRNKIFVIIAVINILICTVAYAKDINRELSHNLLRLHIIANSNSEYDQSIKIKVRDELIKGFNKSEIGSREDVIKNLEITDSAINRFLKNNSVDYGCTISYEKSQFPKKDYEDISMPSGEYECVKVVLGKGTGENWWCIAYPPLCFTNSAVGKADTQIGTLLDEDTYNIITSQENEYKIKFKIVDIINSLSNYL